MEENNERMLEEIDQMLKLAKLENNDVLPVSQRLYFTKNNLYNNNYKLLELDPYLLKEITEGQTLFIKGDDDESVVLCSKDRTYDVKGAETSNSLLLMDNLKYFSDLEKETNRTFQRINVCGVFYDYLLVTSGQPNLEKLTKLLKRSVYKGPEYEHEIKDEDLYSFEDLNATIQASEKELKQVLSTMPVVTVNGKIRLLDLEYHFRVLTYMVKLIDENSWALDEIDYEETLNALRDIVPEDILSSLFDKYTEESQIVDGLQLYTYKESVVCKFYAQVILYSTGKSFNLNEFLQVWKDSVPEGMTTDEELLQGIAIIDRSTQPNTIRAFPVENLPQDINARFEVLFNEKEKWTVSEITPYIQPLTTDKLDVNALLAKHARASHVKGVKYYGAKHGK